MSGQPSTPASLDETLSAQFADHILLSFNDLSLIHYLLSQFLDLQSELPQELQSHLQHRPSILGAIVSPLGRSVGVDVIRCRSCRPSIVSLALSVPSVGFSSCRAASLTLVGGLTTRPDRLVGGFGYPLQIKPLPGLLQMSSSSWSSSASNPVAIRPAVVLKSSSRTSSPLRKSISLLTDRTTRSWGT
jgi:hypothetical protein